MASYLRSWWLGTNTREPSDDFQIPSIEDPLKTPTLSSPPPFLSTSRDAGVVDPIDPDPAKSLASISVSTSDETRADVDSEERTPIGRVLNDAGDVRGMRRQSSRAQPRRKTEAELMPPPPLPPAASSLSSSSNAASSPEVVDDDTPPMFPIPSSIQRLNVSWGSNAESPSTPRPRNKTSFLMPPPPPSIRAPQPPAATGGNNALLVPSSTKPGLPSKRRRKVALAPGHSPLDWAALKTSGKDLRGVTSLMRITPSQLKRHNTREDAWASFNGKVYNITPYLPFHPGGDELMRVAGRDGTKLFTLTHAWVNLDIMLDECLVGFLVPEPYSSSSFSQND